jgi:acylphosphatase
MEARRYWISGLVQGVGYRYFAVRAAGQLRLSGWVRNLDDGRVEVYAVGDLKHLDQFEAKLREGPRLANVRSVQAEDAAADARIEGFHIR